MIGTTIAIIGLATTSAVSIGTNIFQGIQNNKMRKQIEQLKAIIFNQQSDLEELKTQMEALKIWAFKQKIKYIREIKEIKKEISINQKQLNYLETNVA